MQFRPGQLYKRPADAEAAWFTDTLDQFLRERTGDGAAHVTLSVAGGGMVTGKLLDARDGAERNSAGVIDLAPPGDTDDPYSVRAEDIVAFQIL